MKLFALDDKICLDLVERSSSPVFIYSRQVATQTFRSLRNALPDRVTLAYAVKANPHQSLLKQFANLDASFDCASIGELERIHSLGTIGQKIFFAGPGKRIEEIKFALEIGARLNVESFEDACAVQQIAASPTEVNLRIHPLSGAEEGNRIIGGVGPSVFGIDEEHLSEFLLRAASLPKVKITGLHIFAASNQRDASSLVGTYEMVMRVARRMQHELRTPLQQIDLGGGLGVPYNEAESALDVKALGNGIARLLADNAWFEGQLLIESGRYLAAPCGTYLVKVVRVKESRGTTFAILEGGVNHLIRPVLTGQPFPVKVIGKCENLQRYTLAGPLCTSLDRLGEVELPELVPGDLLAFGMTGAYGYTEGMTHFLSHPLPKEIWYDT